jgi:hypothetical protein
MDWRRAARENVVLLVGLALPVLLMAGFFLASSAGRLSVEPPRHDLVFAVETFPANAASLPASVRFLVRNGTLYAHYTPVEASGPRLVTGWKRLYRYDAATGAVRPLPFEEPSEVGVIEEAREDVVAATAELRLDPSLEAPDGYALAYGDRGGAGLLTDIFLDDSWRPRLQRGSSRVPLAVPDDGGGIRSGPVEHLGWVVGAR